MANARSRLRSMYAELGVHAAATLVTLALSRSRDRVDQPVEMQPDHARGPPDEWHNGEKEEITDDESDDDVPPGREPGRDNDQRQHRNAERVAGDHRAGPVPALALEPQAAHRTGLVHRELPAPHAALEAPRAAATPDRPNPAHG